MTFPLVPFLAGQSLTAAALNAALSVDRTVLAPVDQTVSASTVLVNSTYLLLTVAANAIYDFEMVIIYDAAAANDIKFDWTGPASMFMRKGYWTSGSAATTTDSTIFHQADDVLTGNAGAIAAGTYMTARPCGTIATIGAGTLQFRFAQLVSGGSTILKAGSSMRLTQTA